MYSYAICMSLVCTRVYSYVLVCHPYVTRMYSYVIRVSLACARVSSVCYSYVLVCTHMSSVSHSHVLACDPYVIRMSLVCTRVSSVCHSYVPVCHSYVTRLWFYHEPKKIPFLDLHCKSMKWFTCESNIRSKYHKSWQISYVRVFKLTYLRVRLSEGWRRAIGLIHDRFDQAIKNIIMSSHSYFKISIVHL